MGWHGLELEEKIAMKKLSFIIGVLASLACYADPVTVPNTFNAGTPAKASEVNANFAALANAVNAAPKPPMLYDSTGKAIGQLVGLDGRSYVNLISDVELVQVEVSRNGFGMIIPNTYRKPERVFFKTYDCTGPESYEDVIGDNTLIRTALVANESGKTVAKVLGDAFSGSEIHTSRGVNDSACFVGDGSSYYPYASVIRTIDLSGFVPPFSIH